MAKKDTAAPAAEDKAAADAAKAEKAAAVKAKAEAAAADKAAKAEAKAKAKAEREAAAAAKKAEREAAKVAAAAEKAAAKAAKKAEREAAKAAAAAAREAARMPEQNGIRRPKPDTLCGKAWAIFDEVSNKNGAPASIKESMVIAKEQGLNETNVRAEYARWRKFFGISGRVEAPKTEEAETAPAS